MVQGLEVCMVMTPEVAITMWLEMDAYVAEIPDGHGAIARSCSYG